MKGMCFRTILSKSTRCFCTNALTAVGKTAAVHAPYKRGTRGGVKPPHYAFIAQLVERGAVNACVLGSNPSGAAICFSGAIGSAIDL